jgi:acyl carrier protein
MIELELRRFVTYYHPLMGPASKAEILREIQLMMKELFELEPDKVQPQTRLIEDLELDSLDAIDLAVKVEETTGMALDEKLIRNLRTIEDVIVAIEAIVAKQGITSFRPAVSDS